MNGQDVGGDFADMDCEMERQCEKCTMENENEMTRIYDEEWEED